jgi:hypothetical protein
MMTIRSLSLTAVSSACPMPCLRQAAAEVLEDLARLRLRVAGADQLAVLVLGDLAADYHQPALAADHVAVTAPWGHPRWSRYVL